MIDITTADHYGHWDFEDIKRLCEYRDQLRGTLSLAEERLANYAQENEQLKAALERITECIEYRDGGQGVHVMMGAGDDFWKAIRDAKKITHSHDAAIRGDAPQSDKHGLTP